MAVKSSMLPNSTISAELVDFGHGRYDAYMNMAIDEVLLDLADRSGKFFFRTYDFTKSSVILANSDSPLNLKELDENVDVTRRISGGKPIYIDDNVLSYSITGPMHGDGSMLKNSTVINNVFGPLIMGAIASIANSSDRLSMGKVYSIEFDGKPIVGNGQHINISHSFLYHGIAAVGPWDARSIDRRLWLRREDYDALYVLPNLHDIAGDGYTVQEYKRILAESLRNAIGMVFSSKSGIVEAEKDEVLKLATAKVASVYASRSWVFRDDPGLKRDSRFCLLWPD
ncbi:MAG: lipoate--protein ligase family protein [Candidatus Micrarchaeia archaeon]